MSALVPASKGWSWLTPRVRRGWYPIALVDRLGSASRARPVAVQRFGVPLVAWIGPEGPVVAEDRCPHRGVPLSGGRVVGGELECPYHGWRFGSGARCTAVPGLDGAPPARGPVTWPCVVQQGILWAWADPEHPPAIPEEAAPHRFAPADDPRYLVVRKVLDAPGPVHAVIENALDVPHTAFLHGGLFRRADTPRRPVTCEITREGRRAVCRYVGESAPTGLAARLLAPGGGTLEHTDAFILPSVLEVDYRLGDDSHLQLAGAVAPIDDLHSEMFAVVSARTPLPAWLVKAVIQPVALRIFRQDAVVLRQVVQRLHDFGEVSYVSTDIDVLGAHILRLMTRAARGEPLDEAPYARTVTMWL
jgi:nitrite reductase/ring-hydroxylating ferredoxin subunit